MGNFCYEYPRPALTADCVVVGIDGNEMKILLIERGAEPFKGKWALPGGFMEMHESADECALRELKEETGISNVTVQQFYTYSAVDRDPRGRVVTVAYYVVVNIADCHVQPGDDAAKAEWFSITHLPPLAFDHKQIIEMALEKIL
jgi:8-oxo-dGTP diphosphatase